MRIAIPLLALAVMPLAAQRLSDFTAPRPLPPGTLLVIGFLGGFEGWNDEHRSVRKLALELRRRGILADTAANSRRLTAVDFIRRALDTNGNGRIDPAEAARARIILYGQSLGGDAVVRTARQLERWGVPVLLTVQVDSVGLRDDTIPANVRAAANFFQHDLFTIQGRTRIHAADPSSTHILGNWQFRYDQRLVDWTETSWARRTLGGSHAKMERDPLLWTQVEKLILEAAGK